MLGGGRALVWLGDGVEKWQEQYSVIFFLKKQKKTKKRLKIACFFK